MTDKIVQAKMKKSDSMDSPKPKGKNVHSNQAEEEHRLKKKAEKKNVKAKNLEPDNSASNGQLQSIGKKSNKAKKVNTQQHKAKKSGWSTLAYINVFLFICLLLISGGLFAVCSGGKFTAESFKNFWPCVQKNCQRIANNSGPVGEKVLEYSKIAWSTTIMGVNETFILVKGYSCCAIDSIYRSAKHLTPYTEQAVTYLILCRDKAGDAFNWLRDSNNWDTILSAVRWFFNFIYEQIIVLKEEMQRNPALKGIRDRIDILCTTLWEWFLYYIVAFEFNPN